MNWMCRSLKHIKKIWNNVEPSFKTSWMTEYLIRFSDLNWIHTAAKLAGWLVGCVCHTVDNDALFHHHCNLPDNGNQMVSHESVSTAAQSCKPALPTRFSIRSLSYKMRKRSQETAKLKSYRRVCWDKMKVDQMKKCLFICFQHIPIWFFFSLLRTVLFSF